MPAPAPTFQLDDELPPWGLQPGEPTDAFANFRVYRNMDQRSIFKLACLLHESGGGDPLPTNRADAHEIVWGRITTLKKQCDKYQWRERARAFDAAMDAEEVAAAVATRRRAVEKATASHINICNGLIAMANRALLAKLPPSGADKLDHARAKEFFDAMSASELLALARAAIATDRMVLGIDSAEEYRRDDPPAGRVPAFSIEEAKQLAIAAAADVRRADDEAFDGELLPPPKVVTDAHSGQDSDHVDD